MPGVLLERGGPDAASGAPILFGPMRIHQSLAQLGSRLDVLSEEQRILEEQLLFQMDVVEEARTRMLLSETLLAEREYRIARDDFDRMSR